MRPFFASLEAAGVFAYYLLSTVCKTNEINEINEIKEFPAMSAIFIYYLENSPVGHGLIYAMYGGKCFRVSKLIAATPEIIQMDSADAMREDARTINRMNPAYTMYGSLQMAPFHQYDLDMLFISLINKGLLRVAA